MIILMSFPFENSLSYSFRDYKNIKINKMDKGDKLSEEKIAEFKEAFQLFDKDNDNFVNLTVEIEIVRNCLFL